MKFDKKFWDLNRQFQQYKPTSIEWNVAEENFAPNALCDGEETDADGCPINQYSVPVIAEDIHGTIHISVFVYVCENDEAGGYFVDASTEKEIDVTRWSYIPI